MQPESYTPAPLVRMTDEAIAHTRAQLGKRPAAKGIRLAVKESGCSGYMYSTDWVDQPADDDESFTVADGVTLFIKRQHLPLVTGTEIDLITQGVNRVLLFRNPNATAECGCGESFSLT